MMIETGIINIDIRSMGNLAKNMVFHGLVQQVEHNKSHFLLVFISTLSGLTVLAYLE